MSRVKWRERKEAKIIVTLEMERERKEAKIIVTLEMERERKEEINVTHQMEGKKKNRIERESGSVEI